MVSFVFERLRILVISSVAGRERVPCVSAESMETGSKRELEKLSMAIREIKKRIKSEKASLPSSAVARKSASVFSWPFCVRAALCVWVVILNVAAAVEFLSEWRRQRKDETAWSQDQIRDEVESLTEYTKNLLAKPATKRGKLALAEACKFVKERRLFDWVREQNSRKGLAPSYSALWRQWADETDSPDPDATRTRSAELPTVQKHRTQRMRRWARRWVVIRGCYKPGPRLEPETLRRKAICLLWGCKKTAPGRQKARKMEKFAAPVLCPESGPRICDHQ